MRPLALFLACSIFIGSIMPERDLREMAKLPVFVEHFIEHLNAGEGFMQFLAEHYGPRHDETGTEEHHDQLPFHNHHHGEQCCPVPFAPPAQPTAMVVALPTLTEDGVVLADPLLPKDLGVSVWRPPKRA